MTPKQRNRQILQWQTKRLFCSFKSNRSWGFIQFWSGVAAPWLSSANLIPTRMECFMNFSAHLMTQVSSCFWRDLRVKLSTQSLKHLSTSELYIFKLQVPHSHKNKNQTSLLHRIIEKTQKWYPMTPVSKFSIDKLKAAK
jgi:hypothetical protein